MNLAGLAVRNLLRRPARTVLAGTGIAVAVGGFVALTGLARSMERAFVETYVQRGSHVLAVRSGTVEIMTATLDASLADELAEVDGVTVVAAELYDLVETERGEHVMVVGWPAGSFLWDTVDVVAGHRPDPGRADDVLLGDGAAEALGARVGGRVTIGNHAFTVAGVFDGRGALAGKMAAVSMETLQRLLGRERKASVFNIRVERPEDSDAIAATVRRLAAAFPALRFTPAGRVGKDNAPMRLLDASAWSVSTAAMLIALAVVANTFLVSVTERRREIGVLMTVGWRARRVVALVLAEGVALALAGGAVGVGAGSGVLSWLADTPALRGFVMTAGSVQDAAWALAAVLVLGVGGAAYPAWRATCVRPVDALRLP